MVIDAKASAALLFFAGRQCSYITKVIVRVHDCNVIRNFQAAPVVSKHFLVGAKDLRNCTNLRVYSTRKNRSLIVEDPLEHLDAFRRCFWPLHWTVVNSAHA